MIQSNFIFYKCALKAGTEVKKGTVGDVGDQAARGYLQLQRLSFR